MARRSTRAILSVTAGALVAIALAAAPSMAATLHLPVVSSVSPASGPLAGNTKITIHGIHLGGTTAVLVGGHKASHVHAVSSSTVTARVPHRPAGRYHVRVEGALGATSRGTRADRYTYLRAPSVSKVRLKHGSGLKGSTVVITGHHLSGHTRVRFGATPAAATSIHDGAITATVPKHAPGLLHVTVSTAGGTSAKQADDLYPMPTPVSERWELQTYLGPEKNVLADISCATATHCVAIDHYDAVWTIDDGVWSDPVHLSEMPERISCPTVGFCVVTSREHLFVFQDGAWTLGPTLTQSPWDGIHGISCASAISCVATTATTYRTFAGGVWSDEKPTPTITGIPTPVLFDDVACYDNTHCIAAAQTPGPYGAAYRFDGTDWSLMDGLNTWDQVAQISCASSTLCAGETIDGLVAIWNGTTWTEPVSFGDDVVWRDNNIVCTGTTCIDDTGIGVEVYSAGTWTRAADSTYALNGCGSATYCIGEDQLGHIATFNGATWGQTSKQLATVGPGSSVSCPAANFCAMTDEAGNAYVYDGEHWSNPLKLADTYYEQSSVSCPTTSYCLATFADRTVASYDGSAWTPEPPTQKAESSLVCPSVGVCMASGKHDTERFADGQWTVVATGGPWLSMSCASMTFCTATTIGSVETWDGAQWRTAFADDELWNVDAHAVSCPTADFCLLVDGGGRAFTYRAGTWSGPEPTLTNEPLSVSCYSPTFCQSFGEEYEQTYDGQYWSAVDRSGDVDDLYSVSALDCYGVGSCVVAALGEIYESHPI